MPASSPTIGPPAERFLSSVPRDLISSLVVFFVALPLCLGVALASDAHLFAGVVSGIVGGILVGLLSGSHASVSGPAAGLTAVVAAEIAGIGSFDGFLLALVFAGGIQIALGFARAGSLAAFFPSSVIKGLLAAIGVILILKQLPHLLGHDTDPEGEMAFRQPDHENTLSELARMIGDIHPGATLIGLVSIALLVAWDRIDLLKHSVVPSALPVVLLGVGMSMVLEALGSGWDLGAGHLVQVPVADSVAGVVNFLRFPDFSQWRNPAVYTAAITLAVVASLETLLNLEGVDKLDPRQRNSPPSRELVAQGVGNLTCGLIGGIPVTSVIVRSSVNLNAGARTKLSTIFHGLLLAISVVLLPRWLNLIPLSCLAAILLVTGVKLASPKLVRQIWRQGIYQFLPFVATVIAIVLTDLLIGVVLGLAISLGFILWSNMKRPLVRVVENHIGGEVIRIELANQVGFLHRASITRALDEVPPGGQILFDAQQTNYIDADILGLIREFKEKTGPARGINVSLVGFRSEYEIEDETLYIDYSTRELQNAVTPDRVLRILLEGHERFRSGRRLTRNFGRSVFATARGQHPLAVVVGCIDSRAPAELIFDAGVGDIFSVRIAGNVTEDWVLGSVEYACAVAGAKLVVVLGHTRCGAVTAAVQLREAADPASETGCEHIGPILSTIQKSIPSEPIPPDPDAQQSFIDSVARRNALRSKSSLLDESTTLSRLVQDGRISIVCMLYDVASGEIELLDPSTPPQPAATSPV